MSTVRVICKNCDKPFDRPVQRGRPAINCEPCRKLLKGEISEPQKIESKPITIEVKQEEVIQEPLEPKVPIDIMAPTTYRVIVTNLGIAHAGDSEGAAEAAYKGYCRKSQEGFGQVGHELVRFLKLNEEGQYDEVKHFVPDRSL